MIQGSEEWRLARCGSLGASQVHEAIARTKTGYGASRANLMATMVCERLTGVPAEGFTNAAMAWGTSTEPQARQAYAQAKGVEVVEVGLFVHPEIAGTHASPDGLIGDDGLLEIKCPQTATHIDTLLSGTIPAKYVTQMQWQMAVCGRDWCDFASYDPRLPPSMRLFIQRIERDVSAILELESEVTGFLAELDAKVERLRALYEQAEAA